MIYLIGGEARSGKTVIRKELLNRYKISGIGTDTLRYMLSHTLKDSGIDHNNTPQINGPLIWPFIDNLIKDLKVYADEDYVIEGDILLPEYLNKYKEPTDIKVCYIAFPTTSVSEKMDNILNRREEGDWTEEYTEKELRKFIKWSIIESKKHQKECKKYGIPFYNLSDDFESGVKEIIEYLVNRGKQSL